MSPDILLTPPLLARRLIAGFVIPWMLSLNTCNQVHIMWIQKIGFLENPFSTFLCLFAPPFPRPLPPLPLPWSGILVPFPPSWSDLNSGFFPIHLEFGHVRFPWFVLVLATATTPLLRDGEKAKSENVSTNESARGERRPMGGDLVFVALFNCLE